MAKPTTPFVDIKKRLTRSEVAKLRRLAHAHGIAAVARSCGIDPETITRAISGVVSTRPSSAIAIGYWLSQQKENPT